MTDLWPIRRVKFGVEYAITRGCAANIFAPSCSGSWRDSEYVTRSSVSLLLIPIYCCKQGCNGWRIAYAASYSWYNHVISTGCAANIFASSCSWSCVYSESVTGSSVLNSVYCCKHGCNDWLIVYAASYSGYNHAITRGYAANIFAPSCSGSFWDSESVNGSSASLLLISVYCCKPIAAMTDL